jgi:citrate lyase subunit beta/citryl-CoA lyase
MFRTLLFIPGNNKRFLEKSKFLYPDILCFDLEDSVPTSEKTIARDMIIEYFCSDQGSNHVDIKNNNNNNANYKDKESSQIFVRINSFESEIYEQDLESIICERLDGIVLPKVNSPSELENYKFRKEKKYRKKNYVNSIHRILSRSCQFLSHSKI